MAPVRSCAPTRGVPTQAVTQVRFLPSPDTTAVVSALIQYAGSRPLAQSVQVRIRAEEIQAVLRAAAPDVPEPEFIERVHEITHLLRTTVLAQECDSEDIGQAATVLVLADEAGMNVRHLLQEQDVDPAAAPGPAAVAAVRRQSTDTLWDRVDALMSTLRSHADGQRQPLPGL
jgi:hypothetical protein